MDKQKLFDELIVILKKYAPHEVDNYHYKLFMALELEDVRPCDTEFSPTNGRFSCLYPQDYTCGEESPPKNT